jgi:hypothetical protein
MDEQRSYHRVPVEMHVKLTTLGDPTIEMEGIVSDVSFGGLSIIVSEELQPGSEVSIVWLDPPFYIEGEAAARGTISGIVMQQGEGVSFRLGVNLSDSASELVQSLLNWVKMQENVLRRTRAIGKRFSVQRKRIKY